jgi:hypothetical protein
MVGCSCCVVCSKQKCVCIVVVCRGDDDGKDTLMCHNKGCELFPIILISNNPNMMMTMMMMMMMR